jgi:hypothetical protein
MEVTSNADLRQRMNTRRVFSEGPLLADIVAKVENRTTPKISQTDC